MEFSSRQDETRSHAAVGMHAKHFEILAAVGAADLARSALLAIHVRFDRALIAGLNVGYTGTDFQHLDTQLVPRNSRVAVERHLAEISADISSADADTMHAHQRLASLGLGRFLQFENLEILWLV